MNTLTIRRLIFLVILLAVTMPLIFNVSMTNRASPETEQMFRSIDSLQSGQILLVSFDHEASTFAEVRPLAEVVLEHAFRKKLRVVGVSLFAEGAALGEQVLSSLAKERQKVYGHDYVYLGYRPQYTAAILAMGESIVAEFPADYYGNRTDTIAIFQDVRDYSQVAAVISVADGSMPTYWVEYAVARYGVNLKAAVTATMATSFYPYLNTGQIKGMVAGLKGAAEYELLLGTSGSGKRGLFAQSVSQSVVVLLILAGNLVEYRVRRRK